MTLYKKFMKHAKKIAVNLSGSKPVLEGVNHFENGDLVATNAHVLYYGKELHVKDINENTVITPSGKKLDLEYPNVSRLIPDYTPNFYEAINVDVFLKAIEIVHVPGKVDKQVTDMLFEGDTILYKSVATYTRTNIYWK